MTVIPKFDIIFRGTLTLTSTFHSSYTINEVIASSPNLHFAYN
jgi:hypothetical protein